MKKLIDKITNKDRLVKLYRCSECKRATEIKRYIEGKSPLCPKCNGNGYTINRDSQVLDIVKLLSELRISFQHGNAVIVKFTDKKKMNGCEYYSASALIKLIELAYEEDLEREWDFDLDTGLNMNLNIDVIMARLTRQLVNTNLSHALSVLLLFCNHHKIDIWQSVAEILEGE